MYGFKRWSGVKEAGLSQSEWRTGRLLLGKPGRIFASTLSLVKLLSVLSRDCPVLDSPIALPSSLVEPVKILKNKIK